MIETNPEMPNPEAPLIDAYVLGGREMERIDTRLRQTGAVVLAPMTTWEDADIASRSGVIDAAHAQGYQPVLIEHRGADNVPGVHHIDHHGENSHRPAAISQVLDRLGIEPNMYDRVVAANDSGYIQGMETSLDSGGFRDGFMGRQLATGADPATAEARYQTVRGRIVDSIRRQDRKAQGVSEADELEAVEAIEHMEDRNGLKVVTLNGHRTSPVEDRLYATWEEGKENLVVVCAADKAEKEVWFFGAGDVSKETLEHFAAKKQQRIEADPEEPQRRGIYHTVGGGLGFGDPDRIARCLVVADDQEKVIQYIEELEASKKQATA